MGLYKWKARGRLIAAPDWADGSRPVQSVIESVHVRHTIDSPDLTPQMNIAKNPRARDVLSLRFLSLCLLRVRHVCVRVYAADDRAVIEAVLP